MYSIATWSFKCLFAYSISFNLLLASPFTFVYSVYSMLDYRCVDMNYSMIASEEDYLVATLANEYVTSAGELSHLLYWMWKLNKAHIEYMQDDATWNHLADVNYSFDGQIKFLWVKGRRLAGANRVEIIEGDVTVRVYKYTELKEEWDRTGLRGHTRS